MTGAGRYRRTVTTWTRRSFLGALGGFVGGTVVLGAYGGSGGGSAKPGGSGGPFELGQRFSTDSLVPGPVRLPISIVRGGQIADDGPDRLVGRIADQNGKTIAKDIVAVKRSKGLPGAYWAFSATVPSPGFYTLYVDGATPDGAAFQINDPKNVQIPQVGSKLPPYDTPTVADPRGVNPVCTREPACPLHSVTLTQALAAGKPVAYMIATPAFCQFGVCAPASSVTAPWTPCSTTSTCSARSHLH